MFKMLSRILRGSPSELGGIPTVSFDPRRVTAEIKALIKADIDSLPEIPTQLRKAALRAAIESASRGRDLSFLSRWLIEQDIPGLNQIDAARIAVWINNRVTVQVKRAEQMRLGIVEGVWLHSGAPCFRSTAARDDFDLLAEAHRAASGKRFSLADGMLIHGEPRWPGMDEGCRCTWRAAVPGFD